MEMIVKISSGVNEYRKGDIECQSTGQAESLIQRSQQQTKELLGLALAPLRGCMGFPGEGGAFLEQKGAFRRQRFRHQRLGLWFGAVDNAALERSRGLWRARKRLAGTYVKCRQDLFWSSVQLRALGPWMLYRSGPEPRLITSKIRTSR